MGEARSSRTEQGRPVLFLDIDGVLRPADEPVFDASGQLLESAKRFVWLPNLEAVVRDSVADVSIVVSSDWCRIVDDDGLRTLLGPLGACFSGAVEASPRLSRAQGIEQYAARHHIVRWLAVDDDTSVKVAAQRNSRFLWCDPGKGLSEPRVQERIAAFLEYGRVTR